jgi:hypothetical protein
MSVNLGGFDGAPAHSPDGSPGPNPVAQGVEIATESLRNVWATMPTNVKDVPGDPLIARRTGLVAGALLVLTALLAPMGALAIEASHIAHLANLYGLALGALTVLLEVELPQAERFREAVVGQARFLAAPQGMGALHLAQGALAIAQGSIGHVIAGTAALAACALDFVIWYLRRGAMMDTDGASGLMTGQSTPGEMHMQSMDTSAAYSPGQMR